LKEQATEERKPDPVVGYLMGRLELHILKDLSLQDPDTRLKETMSELAEQLEWKFRNELGGIEEAAKMLDM